MRLIFMSDLAAYTLNRGVDQCLECLVLTLPAIVVLALMAAGY